MTGHAALDLEARLSIEFKSSGGGMPSNDCASMRRQQLRACVMIRRPTAPLSGISKAGFDDIGNAEQIYNRGEEATSAGSIIQAVHQPSLANHVQYIKYIRVHIVGATKPGGKLWVMQKRTSKRRE